jgi:tRNA (uracil-5-)-methyltransferase TRM9
MDDETAARLNALNQSFYESVGDAFERLRRGAWPGWKHVIVAAQTAAPPDATAIKLLDVGCGNGRFGRFVARHVAPRGVYYHGLDNSPRLLDHARTALAAVPALSSRLEQVDLVAGLPDLPQQAYDLVGCFGLFHHIPGAARRLALARWLGQRVAKGGLLAFACWRFAEYERYRARLLPLPADINGERHDYLLDWRQDVRALRYCHYVDDDEQAALASAGGLTLLTTFRADGETGDVNCYSTLRRDAD